MPLAALDSDAVASGVTPPVLVPTQAARLPAEAGRCRPALELGSRYHGDVRAERGADNSEAVKSAAAN